MRVRRDVLCVLTACSAFAGVVPGPVQAGEPFDVFILAVDSPFFESKRTYVRTRPGGEIRIDRVWVQTADAPAPATTVAFRWKEGGRIVETVSVRAIKRGDVGSSGRGRVPFPARDGRYHLWMCADTPRAGPPERRVNNCVRHPKLVIVRRTAPMQLDVSPTSWNFDSVPSGSSSEAQNFTVRNLGPGNTGPGTVVIDGSGAGAFEVGSNGCPPGLNGTSACRIRVTFTPPAPGSYSAELVVTFDRGELRVPLSGTGA